MLITQQVNLVCDKCGQAMADENEHTVVTKEANGVVTSVQRLCVNCHRDWWDDWVNNVATKYLTAPQLDSRLCSREDLFL